MTARAALVTGGTRGIGRGIVEALLADGHRVAMTGRSQQKGSLALAELDAGDRAVFLCGDARSQSDVEGWVSEVEERLGPIDILVNNAGGCDGFALVHQMSDEAWRNAQDFILTSAFWATRAALRSMTERGSGRIVNISSLHGKVGSDANVSHYITFKHAINGFTKAVAFEYGRRGITCNAICPGGVETDLMQEVGPTFAAENDMTYDEYKQEYAKGSFTGQLNTVQEVAAVVQLLVGPAGAGITGSLINVDGGTSPF